MKYILDEIRGALDTFERKAHTESIAGNGAWTHGIKRSLAEIGTKYGYKICCSGFPDEYEREWLYDMTWYKEHGGGDSARLMEIPLVMECEWDLHFHGIKYDFEKLLLSNSNLKVMICQSSKENRSKLINYFTEAIQKYSRRHADEKFLISIFDCHDEDFHHRCITQSNIWTIS